MKRYIANWVFWHAPDWVIGGLAIALPYHVERIIEWAAEHSDTENPHRFDHWR